MKDLGLTLEFSPPGIGQRAGRTLHVRDPHEEELKQLEPPYDGAE